MTAWSRPSPICPAERAGDKESSDLPSKPGTCFSIAPRPSFGEGDGGSIEAGRKNAANLQSVWGPRAGGPGSGCGRNSKASRPIAVGSLVRLVFRAPQRFLQGWISQRR